MCRAVFMKKIKEGVDNNMFPLTLNYLLNAHNRGNKQGYFIRFDNNEIRTINFDDAFNFVTKHKEEINQSNRVLLHCRMATHGASINEFVHGWRLGDHYCFHNGVVELKNKTLGNDSLDFFTEVTKSKKILKNIRREIKTRYGSGAFFMIADNSPSYIFSKNHTINIHLLNRSIIVINSNDDIHEFSDTLLNVGEENIKVWGLDFPAMKTEKIDAKVEIFEDLKIDFEDNLLVIGKNGVTSVEELETYQLPINSYTKNVGYNYPNYTKKLPIDEQKEIYDWYNSEKNLMKYEKELYRGD